MENKKPKITIENTEFGFTVWIEEPHPYVDNKRKKYWLLDASCFYNDNEIRICNDVDDNNFSLEIINGTIHKNKLKLKSKT